TLFGFLLGRGVHAICKSYGDEENPRGHVFFVDQKDELADIANDEEIEFFRKFLQK
ncbi:MAG: alpha/beta hydrolase, partial [Lactobacillus crispatus]|nr:alpha/beta hydrolase [Lactobacillus crispatus]